MNERVPETKENEKKRARFERKILFSYHDGKKTDTHTHKHCYYRIIRDDCSFMQATMSIFRLKTILHFTHTHTHTFHFISFPSVHTTYKMLSHWLFIHVECVIEFNNSLCFQFIRAILFGWFLDNGLFQHTQLSLPSTINTDIWRDDYNNFAYGLFSVIFVLHEWMCVWFVWTTTINVFLGF